MTEQANANCFDVASMSLLRAIQWIECTLLRRSDHVLGWRAIFKEAGAPSGYRWHTFR
jgi:hypothetical protein